LGVTADGDFGSKTEAALIAYQEANGLDADGKAGKKTFEYIISKAPTLRVGAEGAYVFAVEALLTTMKLDGKYEKDEADHVKTYQAAKNLEIDSIVGKKTYRALFGLDGTSSSSTTPATTGQGTNTTKPVDYKQYDSRWKSKSYTSTGKSS